MLTFMDLHALVNVVNKPELRYTPNKKPVLSLVVASNRSWTDHAGDKQEDSCFIACTAWNKLAENINKYVGKGDPLYIEGSLYQESWVKDDIKHTKYVVMLTRVVFIKSKE